MLYRCAHTKEQVSFYYRLAFCFSLPIIPGSKQKIIPNSQGHVELLKGSTGEMFVYSAISRKSRVDMHKKRIREDMHKKRIREDMHKKRIRESS